MTRLLVLCNASSFQRIQLTFLLADDGPLRSSSQCAWHDRLSSPAPCASDVQDAAAAAGDAHLGTQLWAVLLRAHALLPLLPRDAAGALQDEAAHEASTAGASPPAAVSLSVSHAEMCYRESRR